MPRYRVPAQSVTISRTASASAIFRYAITNKGV
jgi:hypothetical protein